MQVVAKIKSFEILNLSLAQKLLLVFTSSLLIALLTQIKIGLFFTPVPVTGQTFAVLMTAYVLGPKLGVLSVLSYLFMGVVGLPFFASGSYGLLYFKGVTGGYLIGFLLTSLTVGYFSKKGLFKNFFISNILFLIGLIPTFIIGILWLGNLVGFDKALNLGLYPFVPGEVLKVILASSLITFSNHFPRK